MRAIKNAYVHLGTYLKENVKDQNGNPIFKHVDLWQEQTEFKGDDERDDDELPFDCPALFIDFDVPNVSSNGLYTDELDTLVTFYVAFDSLEDTHIGSPGQDTATLFLEYLCLIHELIQGYANSNSGIMNRVGGTGRYRSRSNLMIYRMPYQTLLRDGTATAKRKPLETVTVDLEPKFTKRPAQQPNNEGSGENWFQLP
jgi:hypothetical protein